MTRQLLNLKEGIVDSTFEDLNPRPPNRSNTGLRPLTRTDGFRVTCLKRSLSREVHPRPPELAVGGRRQTQAHRLNSQQSQAHTWKTLDQNSTKEETELAKSRTHFKYRQHVQQYRQEFLEMNHAEEREFRSLCRAMGIA